MRPELLNPGFVTHRMEGTEMIFVDIESDAIATKRGEKNGKAWRMNLQQIAYVGHYVDGFPAKLPRESTIQLDDQNPQPYPPGRYVIASDSFFFGDFGRFTMGRLKLQPVSQFIAELQKQIGAKVVFEQPKAA